MDFALTDEHELLVASVDAALARTAGPAAVRDALAAGRMVPVAWQALADAGVLGLLAGEEAGGAGLGWLEAALVAEAIGRFAVPVPVVGHLFGTAVLAAAPVSPALRAEAAAGAMVLVPAVAEAAGWERDTASRVASGEPITTAKRHIAFAADADRLVVVGRDGAVLVDPAGPGVTLSSPAGIDGTAPVAEVSFAAAPAEPLPIAPHDLDRAVAGAQVATAAAAMGAATAAITKTIGYLDDRRQFGRPLTAFQAVRHQLADAAAATESARSFVWYAAALLDEGAADAPRIARIAKAHVVEQAVAAIRRCVVLHGAIGFAWECDLHLWLKHVMLCWAQFGPPAELRRAVATQDIGA